LSPESIARFRVHFDAVVAGFKSLLSVLGEIKDTDSAAYEQYRGAFIGLINRMQAAL
jgi:hypothetical protein